MFHMLLQTHGKYKKDQKILHVYLQMMPVARLYEYSLYLVSKLLVELSPEFLYMIS
jgi:hypothetical protein